MSTGAEQELKERLGHAVGAVTPRPAPVDLAMRQGRAIRTRRRVTGLVCAAVAAAVAVAVPLLLNGHLLTGRSQVSQHTVVVHPGGGHTRGLVGYGTVDGKPWQIRAVKPGTGGASRGEECWNALGTQGCGAPHAQGSDPAELNVSSKGTLAAVYGPVAARVSALRATLVGGTHLTLHPVTVYGIREVAFAAPASAIASVTAYSPTGEVATTVPLHSPDGSLYFGAWLRPGQRPLPRIIRVVGSGRTGGSAWKVTDYQGPWGQCMVVSTPRASSSACSTTLGPPGTALMGMAAGLPAVAYFGASAATEHVVITLSDGSQTRVAAVAAGTRKYFAFAAGKGVHAVRWTAYDSNRHQIASERAPKGF
jgi:hypothetical protein